MKRIEKERDHIRNNWFKNHVATLIQREDITILKWGKPGTSLYQMQYIMTGDQLFISGDLGSSIYDLTWKATIESFSETDINYFMSKLSCSSRNRWQIDEQKGQREIDEWFLEQVWDALEMPMVEALKEVTTELTSAITEYEAEAYEHEVWRVIENHSQEPLFLEGEDFELFSKFGRVLPNNFIAYLLGLKMANEQLKGG